MARHEIKIKLKADDIFDDIYSDDAWNGLYIPAYRKSPGLEQCPSPKSHKQNLQNLWKWSILMAIFGLVNCYALAFRLVSLPHQQNSRQNIGKFIPWWSNEVPIAASVAAARLAAANAADQLKAELSQDNGALPNALLQSSLADWTCSKKASQYREQADATRSAFAGRLHRKTAEQAGGIARQCGNSWDEDLPKLHTLKTIGYDPSTFPPAKPKPPPGKDGPFGVTLVIPVPISRLHVLENQCNLWPGLPLAAAVYIPLSHGRPFNYSGLDTALSEVLSLAARIRKRGSENACILRAEILYEETCGESLPEPLNALRNRALRLVDTEAVVIADGMHFVSATLASAFKGANSTHTLMLALRTSAGVVIPSLAPANAWIGRLSRHAALEIASMKFVTGVINLVKSRQLDGPLGWGQLDTAGRSKAIGIWQEHHHKPNVTILGDDASPHVVMMAANVPWFDERLRGSAWAHATHVRHAEAVAGTTSWATFGGAWAVRLAPADQQVGNQGGAAQARSNKVLAQRWIADIAKGRYEPAVALSELCYVQRR